MTFNNTPEPLNYYRRQQEREKEKSRQKSEMGARRVEQKNSNYHHAVGASQDSYMKEALRKVRQSEVTHDERLTRMNGNWLHNQSLKK